MARKATQTKTKASYKPSMKLVEFTPAKASEALVAAGAAKSGKMNLVEPDKIVVVPGFNTRLTETQEYQDGIRELAESIKAEGFYDTQPLGVFPAEIDGEPCLALISGHRRYEAALIAIEEGADVSRLPVVLKKPGSTDLELAVSLYKENLGVRPTILERAILANRLWKVGMDDDEIALRLGVTNKHIRDLKTILNAPKNVRDLIRDGKIAAYEAITRLRKDPTGNSIVAAAEKADERAANMETKKAEKLTKKTLDRAERERDPMVTTKLSFSIGTGDEFLYEDVEQFLPLIDNDETWFKGTRSPKRKVALSSVSFDVTVKRSKTADELQAEVAAEEVAKASRVTARKAKAPAAVSLDDDDLSEDDDDANEDEDMDDDLTEAPDLAALGIAEPASSEL